MKVFDDDGTELTPCEACRGQGRWQSSCCNGAGGCSCRGDIVEMGDCHVCYGKGWRRPDANLRANVESIRGQLFLGSGPYGGYFGRY